MCAATVKISAAAFEQFFFSGNISCFFKERATASERYQEKCTTASEKKCAAAS